MAALAVAIGATLTLSLAAELGHGAFSFRPHGIAAVAAEWSSGCHRVHNALREDFAQGGYLRRNGIDATIEAMTSITPITQSAAESLRNALTIAQLGRTGGSEMGDIARLLRAALAKLGEPSPRMIEAVRAVVGGYSSLPEQFETLDEMDRYWRDNAAIILRAAVEGT